jgi:hypothetical protein
MKRLAPLLLTLAVLMSCVQSKPIPEQYQNLVGTWKGNGFDLLITADGGASYHRISGSGETTFKGPLNSISDQQIEFGFLFFHTKLVIEEAPRQVDGKYEMTVDHVRLVRQDY